MASNGALVYRQMTRLAWRNVVRNWRHSLATILAIASGFMAVSLFDGFIRELRFRSIDSYTRRGMFGELIAEKVDAQQSSDEDQWQYSLDAKEQKFLEDFFAQDPNFQRRVRFLGIAGMLNAGTNTAVFGGWGYDLEDGIAVRGNTWAWNVMAGQPLEHAVPAQVQSGVVIGRGLGHLIECESTYTGPPFILEDGNYVPEVRPFQCKAPRISLSVTTESAQVNSIDMPVVGLIDAGFRETDQRTIHISLQDAQRLLDTDKISMAGITLKDNSPAAIEAFAQRLRAAIAKSGLGIEVITWDKHKMARVVTDGMGILQVFRDLFMAIVVTIGVMSVANTMMKSVNERIREIGTLRSIGFLRRHLIWMFGAEGFFLSLIACAVGLALTLVLSFGISKLGITFKAGFLSVPILLKVTMAPKAWAFSAVLLSTLATGTAWFCARRAARMVIADAMRHV